MSTKTVSARISEDLHKSVLQRANNQGVSINDFIIMSLENSDPHNKDSQHQKPVEVIFHDDDRPLTPGVELKLI